VGIAVGSRVDYRKQLQPLLALPERKGTITYEKNVILRDAPIPPHKIETSTHRLSFFQAAVN
jgi:hypothetical protein